MTNFVAPQPNIAPQPDRLLSSNFSHFEPALNMDQSGGAALPLLAPQ